MRKLTADHLHKIFPGLTRAKCALYAPDFNAAIAWGQINTRQRLCAFAAQLGHESEDLAHLREIWGPTPAQARYDVRADLGNTPERDGDGKLYMGRGGIGRTGKKNYRRFQEATGVPVLLHPELLEKPEYAFQSDVLYWTDNKLNRIADQLTLRGDANDLKTFDKLTRAINGGYNGRVDRQRRYLVAIATLPDELFQPEAMPAAPSALDTLNQKIAVAEIPVSVEKPKEETKNSTPPILLEKLSSNESAKAAGLNIGKKIGLRLGGPIAVFYAALQAGSIYAWLGLAVLFVGGAVLIYYQRHRIADASRSLAKLIEDAL